MCISLDTFFRNKEQSEAYFIYVLFNRSKLLAKQTAGSNTGPPHTDEKEKATILCRICCPHVQPPKLLLPPESRGGRYSVVMW